MDKCSKAAALYVATLRAIYFIHQQNHWLTSGNDFYGDHLLFQRLYEAVQEDIDGAAEKFIGIMGPDCMNYSLQSDLIHKVTSKYANLADKHLECSLAIEKDFIKFSKTVYECFEAEGTMTLGLDDFIMATASKREDAVYLLQQAMGGLKSK